jgi:hypothetical protein
VCIEKHILQIRLCDNLIELFIKSVSSRIFEQLIQKIDLRHLRDDCMIEKDEINILCKIMLNNSNEECHE